MKDSSLQVAWNWKEVKDTKYWKIPDGAVMRLIYLLGKDDAIKVYDLGCGLGRHTVFFASQGYQVAASDLSEEAVNQTRRWLQEENLSAAVEQGRMTEIKQPDNEFDLVISFNVMAERKTLSMNAAERLFVNLRKVSASFTGLKRIASMTYLALKGESRANLCNALNTYEYSIFPDFIFSFVVITNLFILLRSNFN